MKRYHFLIISRPGVSFLVFDCWGARSDVNGLFCCLRFGGLSQRAQKGFHFIREVVTRKISKISPLRAVKRGEVL